MHSLAPPQSWPEFKLKKKNYPGHCVCIKVLSKEYHFNQRKGKRKSPKQLIKEIGGLIDVNVDDVYLAAAHRLPDTKNVKHWVIVKFVHSDKRIIEITTILIKNLTYRISMQSMECYL